jgi:putative membrane protein
VVFPTDAPDAGLLTDAQIIGVANAANTGEITEGNLALTKSTNTAVKAFATMMVNDHTTSNMNLTMLEQQTGLMPAASGTQMDIQTAVQQTMTMLMPLTGNSFDTAYVASQVTTHQTVQTLLMNVLIPEAQNGQLKAFLQAMLTTVNGHLQLAIMLQSQLLDGGATR